MLIVEGADGLGKTTLCKELCRRLAEYGPWVYRHFTRLPECWDYPRDYAPHVTRHVVQDRFHMSEVAYRLARGEKARLTPGGYRWVDGLARLVGAYTIVLIDPTGERIKRRWTSDQMHDLPTTLEADAAFRHLAYNQLTPFIADCDMCMHVHVDDRWPAEDECAVKKIVEQYLDRQLEVFGTLSRKEERL